MPAGRKKTLDLCKGGMLGKDNALEVVLNPAHDPGADKPRPEFRLLRSGQVFSQGEDTGGACSKPTLGEFLPERRWRRNGSTSLVYRHLPSRSNHWLRNRRPNREKPAAWRRRRRDSHGAPDGLNIGQRIHFLAAVDAKDGAADQEERHIGADLSGQVQSLREQASKLAAKLVLEPNESGNGVAGACAKATLDGQALFDMNLDFMLLIQRLKCQIDHPPGGVSVISGHAAVVRGDLGGRLVPQAGLRR